MSGRPGALIELFLGYALVFLVFTLLIAPGAFLFLVMGALLYWWMAV